MPPDSPGAETILAEAVGLPDPAARAAFLDRACGGDAALRERVGRLVEYHFKAGSFLEHHPVALFTDETADFARPGEAGPAVGGRVGPYALRELVGEGGMGLVFVAEQTEPVRRTVALKVIKPGMDSRQVIARFEAERQALALMDHPNIAKVLDAGETAEGRPYFVMELVTGAPVTEYCDEHRLTVRHRLGLFLQVCAAVQHAHQKGVIHRDLKPSNVLVTVHDGRPVAKVIDFGIAKAVGPSLTDLTLCTGAAQLLGTPLYMSPEQAGQSGFDVDTRTDVYALGVLLYELLTGSTPFDGERLRAVGLDEFRRIVREEEPARPSARLSTLLGAARSTTADRRGADPLRLAGQLRGEVDWVVMRCLEKDRDRRYESAAALAADVRRYLSDEPVSARPPSVGYRARKFLRRNRGPVLVAGVLLIALSAVGGSVGWAVRDRAARRAEADRVEADRKAEDERERNLRQAKADQRLDSALVEVEKFYAAGRWPVAREVIDGLDPLLSPAEGTALEERVRRWRADLDMLARIEATRAEKGDVRTRAAFDDPPAEDAAWARAFREYGIDVDQLTADDAAAVVRRKAIRAELLVALDEWSTARRRNTRAAGDWRHLSAVARAADPDPLRRRIRAVSGQPAADDRGVNALVAELDPSTVPPATAFLLADRLLRLGRRGDAERILRQVWTRHPEDFNLNTTLGGFFALPTDAKTDAEKIRQDESIRYFSVALALRPQYPVAHRNLGAAMSTRGRLPHAEWCAREAIRLKPDYVDAHNNLGVVFGRQKKWADAEASFREAIRLNPDHVDAHYNLGVIHAAQGHAVEAERHYRVAVRVAPHYAEAHFGLGKALNDQDKWADAARCYREAIRLKPDYDDACANLAGGLARQGIPDAAASSPEALRLRSDVAEAYYDLGVAFAHRGKWDVAEGWFRKATGLKPDFAAAHGALGSVLGEQGEWDEAEGCLREKLRLKPDDAEAHRLLGVTVGAQGRSDEAVTYFREAIRVDRGCAEAYSNLSQALLAQRRPAEAAAVYRSAIEVFPREPTWPHNLARLLANSRNPNVRDPKEAVRHAERAVELEPENGWHWGLLGVARYRAGEWRGAVVALSESVERTHADSSVDSLFLAMAHWQLGSKREARAWFDRVATWMDRTQSQDAELRHFRAEAAELLGILAPPPREVRTPRR